ncbi:MAG: hypothetical protein QOI91_1132 [Solirubrobacteraceae bacterium]|jgi:hypothetical protein|nr:hypothetical protein [Solirubrobacteraceae bacterium]
MTRTALTLVRDFFVAPERAAPRETAGPVPPVVVVLGDVRVVPALACAAAVELARIEHWSHAAVCLWPGERRPAARLPASGVARRTATRLAARGCEADASARLARAFLPDEPVAAAAAAQRVAAAADCPLVIGLAGARTPHLEALLTLGDAVILARRPTDSPALARLAEAGLAALRTPVFTCEAPAGAAVRAIATAGLRAPSPVRTQIAPVLGILA